MYHFQAYHTIDNGVSLFEISRSGDSIVRRLIRPSCYLSISRALGMVRAQKSVTRPPFSQSPYLCQSINPKSVRRLSRSTAHCKRYLVGSGPRCPPISPVISFTLTEKSDTLLGSPLRMASWSESGPSSLLSSRAARRASLRRCSSMTRCDSRAFSRASLTCCLRSSDGSLLGSGITTAESWRLR